MTRARALLFNVAFWLWTAVLYLMVLPVYLLGPRSWLVPLSKLWLRPIHALARRVIGLDYEVRGRANLPESPCLIAAKHQSAWEIFALLVELDQPAFVLKRELMRIPLFGWYTRRYGAVPIDRSGGSAALRSMLRSARGFLDAGRAVVIFPEGTRLPPGARGAYHPGVAALYRDLGVPVVPLALNAGAFWGRRALDRRPGRIVLEFLAPIPPGLDRKTFMATLADRLEPASDRLLAEARDAGAPEGPARGAAGGRA